jgi:hypothetical protein
MKTCTQCKETKELEEFPRSRKLKSGRCSQCKVCNRIAGRSYYERNKEKLAKYWREVRVVRGSNQRERGSRIVSGAEGVVKQVRHIIERGFYVRCRKRRYVAMPLSDHMGGSWIEVAKWLGEKPIKHELDHICPLSQAKTEEEFFKLWHYSNLQWLTPSQNRSKGAKRTPEGEALCLALLGRPWIDAK